MNLKKIISLLVAVSMLFTLFITTPLASTTPTLSASSVAGKTGETVVITVSASNNPGIAMAKAQVKYDTTALKLINVVDTGLWAGQSHKANYTACPYTLYWDASKETAAQTANGELVTLTFEILSGAETKDYDIELIYKEFNAFDLSEVVFSTVNGKISVTKLEPTIKASSASAKNGATASIIVSAENNPGIAMAKAQVKYDTTALKLINVVDTGLWAGQSHKTNYTACPYTLYWDASKETAAQTANGELVTLKFEVLEGAVIGNSYDIELIYKEFNAFDLSEVVFNTVNGTITVTEKDPEEITLITSLDDKSYDYTGDCIKYPAEEYITPEAYAAGIGLKGVVYTGDNYNSDVAPTNAGTYTATVTYGGAGWIDKVLTATLTINKVEVNEVPYTNSITFDANDANNASADAVKAALSLPATIDVPFGGGLIEHNVAVSWSDADTEWDVKGGKTYTYTGTLSSDNLEFANDANIKATATVDAVNGTLDTSIIEDKTIPKADATGSVFGIADIFPVEANLTYGETTEPVRLVWNMDDEAFVAALAAAAEGVSDGVDQEVTLTLNAAETLANYPWLTIDAGATAKVTITNKFPADVTLEIESDSMVYGSTVNVTAKECSTVGADAEINITYKDSKGNVSTEAPTDAGTYTVIATLKNAVYSGSASKTFTIAPKDIVVVVNDDADMIYGGDYKKVAELKEGYELEYGETVEDLKLTYKVIDELGKAVDHTKAAVGGVYKITATDDNPNYNVSVVDGILTINKASIAGLKPEITGDAIAGGTLTAKFEKTDNFNYVWTVGGVDIPTGNENYLDILPEDSNQNVTVKVIATDVAINYTGESDPSETNVKVETYDVSLDVFEATIDTDDPNGAIKAGTIVSVSVVGFEDDSVLGLTYEWTIDGKVQQATGKEFTVPDGIAGVVVVTATPNGNFIGKITKEIGEIGKITLEGQVELDKVNPVVGDVITATINSVNATPENFDLVWVVDRVPTTVTGTTYTVTKADLGKTITARLVGKESYTGDVDAINTANVEPLAPSDVVITTEVTKNSIAVTVTANANGDAIKEYALTLKDSEGNVVEEATATIAEGKGTCTFANLDSGKTYTIEAVATNGKGSDDASAEATTKKPSSTLSPVTGGATTPTKPSTPPATETPSTGETETPSTGETETPSTGETETPATPETTIVVPEADVVVESKTETATVPAADLADASVVAATVTTESGAKVDVTVDVADKAVDSLTVSADKANAEVTGKAADGIVGDAIEVKVDAKSGDTAVAVEATIAIDVEAQAYAYAVDELGNTVRLESAYDAETGKLLVAGVADGTVVAVSTTAPVDFADTADRWSDKEVKRAVDLGIVNGRSADAYAPAELLTRSETNKLKKNLAEVLKLELTVNADVKIDTDPSHWAYEADLWAAQTGITSGTGKTEDGTVVISGGDNVVRQDYLTLLARMIKLAIGDVTIEGTGVEFADAEHVADYAADSINLLSSIGILKGSEGADGVYANPKANITREEAAALSNRAYEFVKVLKTAK